MAVFVRRHAVAISALAFYALAWGSALATLVAGHNDAAGDAVAVLAMFGLAFPALGWLTTLGAAAPPIPVRRPAVELSLVLAYLAAYAVLFIGFGLSAFHAALPAGRTEAALLVALKLVVHVALPALLLALAGANLRPLFAARAGGRPFWLSLSVLGLAILALMCVISPSLKDIAALRLAPGALAVAGAGAFAWIAVEAGLCEEFLFRAVLQSRLAAAMKSEIGAVVIGALIFGLAHAPGLFLRGHAGDFGHSQSLIQVVAYTVAVLSPAGIFVGFMWSRTKSLLLVVLLHALVDVLPFIPEFAHTWM